jgi:hypothetical protein
MTQSRPLPLKWLLILLQPFHSAMAESKERHAFGKIWEIARAYLALV